MQTIAVYYEPKVKTYGFNKLEDLVLVRFRLISGQGGSWQEKMDTIDERSVKYILTVLQSTKEDQILVTLVFRIKDGDDALRVLEEQFGVSPDTMEIVSPVELVFFQGPHFGDRWGIAENTFKALEEKGIQVITAGCSGAAIYLVFVAGKGDEAISCLKEVFETPK